MYELSLFSGTIFDVMMVFKDTELDHYLYKGGLSVLRLYGLDKAHRLSINIVIWILSSDTETSAATPVGGGARKVLAK